MRVQPGIDVELLGQSLLAALKAEGVQVDGKEEKLAAKFADIVEVPMTALKNTAYTNGLPTPSESLFPLPTP